MSSEVLVFVWKGWWLCTFPIVSWMIFKKWWASNNLIWLTGFIGNLGVKSKCFAMLSAMKEINWYLLKYSGEILAKLKLDLKITLWYSKSLSFSGMRASTWSRIFSIFWNTSTVTLSMVSWISSLTCNIDPFMTSSIMQLWRTLKMFVVFWFHDNQKLKMSDYNMMHQMSNSSQQNATRKKCSIYCITLSFQCSWTNNVSNE